MEKTPSSVSMGRRRCEMTWMPEKARDWSGIEELRWQRDNAVHEIRFHECLANLTFAAGLRGH